MEPIRVLSVFGTRPEAIKMAPLILEMNKYPDRIHSTVCVTGQHREMLDQILNLFQIVPDYDLNLMKPNQTPIQVMKMIFEELEPIIVENEFDWILAQGDTTTVLATSLLAFHNHIRFGHIEAGLRTGDKSHPFPEEINRRIADLLADRYFAPTEAAKKNLLHEGVDSTHIEVTGNTVIDSLLLVANQFKGWGLKELSDLPNNKAIILVTAHRRENFGYPLEQICLAIRELALSHASTTHFVFPVHKNPNVRTVVYKSLSSIQNITLVDPLDYHDMVHLIKKSILILTDSGGIQEEAPSLNVPVLILRETTERPEAVEAGASQLVGCDKDRIVTTVNRLLASPRELCQMRGIINPYGDGRASERIVKSILNI